MPLAALRERLDEASAGCTWGIDLPGGPGRSLSQLAGTEVRFPLALAAPAFLRARVALTPREWRDGQGGATASVAIVDARGTRSTLWRETVRPAADQQRPDGLSLTCELPATSGELVLGVTAVTTGERSIQRLLWIEPELIDPAAPAPARLPTRAPVGAGPAWHEDGPLVSVLMPVHDPPLAMLEEAIGSVLRQSFGAWELCLVDDGSRKPEILASLRRHAESDQRIRLTTHPTARGIAAATNSAIELATGVYVALLDHDDTLAPSALATVADTVLQSPELDMVYTDEDIVMDGRRLWVHYKPAWSPDTLRTNGYTCHLGVYRRELVLEIGGFRSEFDGSQDVDMILRLVEQTDRIAHIPQLLYHWRAHPASTAGGDAKPYAYVSARNAIEGHLRRQGDGAAVNFGPPGLYRLTPTVPPSHSAAIALAPRDDTGLAEAAHSWLAQPHQSWEVTLCAAEPVASRCRAVLHGAGLAPERVTTLVAAPGDSRGSMLCRAANAATAETVLICGEPVVGLTHDWMLRLLGYSGQPQVAAAGPAVLARDGRVREAGIGLPQGIPLHLLYGRRTSMDDFFGYGTSIYNVAAVSECLTVNRETLATLGGLDPEFGDFAPIEFCLRATASGMRIVVVPDARVLAAGRGEAVNDVARIWQLRQRWQELCGSDPYYNPNFRQDRGDFQMRESTR